MQNTIDGHTFHQLMEAGAECVRTHAAAINALNVFPVPDGDTGINMALTLRSALEGVSNTDSVAGVSQVISRGAIMGARGNSGVILSQFLKGLAAGLSECIDCTAADLRTALRVAADASYQAVGTPVEGTMLTVMRAAAEGAERAEGAVSEILRAARDSAAVALAATPTQLAVLAEAGVVDAGGQGVVALLAGAVGCLDETEPALNIEAPTGAAPSGGVNQEFLGHTEDDLYGYCTQFVVLGQGLEPSIIREQVMAIAGSTVVVGDEQVVRIHGHAEDPGPMLSLGASLGALDQVNIANMDVQHQEFMALHGYTTGERKTLAVVAVVPGAGFDRLFRDQGAGATVAGGQAMNPSTADILSAIERANADNVFILPNNPNVIMAARQAAEMAESRCRVIPSTTAPQGIAAMLALNLDLGVEANLTMMTGALDGVRSGEITTAIRSTTIDGVLVQEGQAIALVDGVLTCACATPIEALLNALAKMKLEQGALVTLYFGARINSADADTAGALITERWPGTEVEVLEGKQPYHHYIISVE